MPKRAKKKRCNPVKAATLLSIIFSCVRTAYLSELSISATSFAVAVTILNPLSMILSSSIKLPPLRGFFSVPIREKELVYRYVIACHKLIKYLQAWLLSLIFNIGKVMRRNIHCVAYIFATFLSRCPRRFYRLPESCEVIKWYRSFSHNYSPCYIV